MAALGKLPIVLETAQQPVWQQWGAEWRDLYVLDRDGDFSTKINLTDFDPTPTVDAGRNYAQLKQLFVTAYNTGVNQTPTANAQSVNGAQGTPLTVTLAGDDGDASVVQTLTFQVQTLPGNGTLVDANGKAVVVGTALPSPTVQYTPNAGFSGSDTFSFTVTDDGGGEATSAAATVSLTITPAPTPPVPPPVAEPVNRAFVAQVYRDVLKREADPNGLTFWVGQMGQGLSNTDVVLAIQNSQEGQTLYCQEVCQDLLGRAPTDAELEAVLAAFGLGGTREQIKAALAGSEGFFQLSGGSNEAFVDNLYQEALGRAPDAAGRGNFLQALADGFTREQVTAVVLASDEYREHVVQGYYQQLLGRGADPTGLPFWKEQFRLGARAEQVITGFLTSSEYLTRRAAPSA